MGYGMMGIESPEFVRRLFETSQDVHKHLEQYWGSSLSKVEV